MQQPETRYSLIVRLKEPRNASAWTQFVSVYEPFLTQLVRRQGTPPHQVADVTQQILMAIVRSVNDWADDGQPASFRRWLGRVARNAAIKFLARERRHARGFGGNEFLSQIDQIPDTVIDDRRIQQYDHEMIVWAAEQVRSEFRETSWQAFWGTQVEGRPVADVAQELGISTGSIYMSRSRIVARIRERIEKVM